MHPSATKSKKLYDACVSQTSEHRQLSQSSSIPLPRRLPMSFPLMTLSSPHLMTSKRRFISFDDRVGDVLGQ